MDRLVKLESLLAHLPIRIRVVISTEEFLHACVFLDPPEGGWVTEGEKFQHPQDSPTWQVPCRESWKLEPTCLMAKVDGMMWEELISSLPAVIDRYRS